MRVLVTSRIKFPVPQEQMPVIMEAFKAWRARYRAQMETFDFFVAADGGCAIVNAPDDLLAQMMLEYPWGPLHHVEIHPLAEGDQMIERFMEAMRQRAAGQG